MFLIRLPLQHYSLMGKQHSQTTVSNIKNVHKTRALQPSQPFVLQNNTTRHKSVKTVACLRLKE